MSDKEWLAKVYLAYSEYQKITGYNAEIEQFVCWLYAQYGIVPPTGDKNNG